MRNPNRLGLIYGKPKSKMIINFAILKAVSKLHLLLLHNVFFFKKWDIRWKRFEAGTLERGFRLKNTGLSPPDINP